MSNCRIFSVIYCLNFMIVKLLGWKFRYDLDSKNFLTKNQMEIFSNLTSKFFFTSNFAAFYEIFVSRIVVSTCGYFVQYLSVGIAIDRMTAFWSRKFYLALGQKKHKKIFWSVIFFSFFLAIFLHSWMNFVQFFVKSKEIPIVDQKSNETFTIFFSCPWANGPGWYQKLITISIVVNGILRIL